MAKDVFFGRFFWFYLFQAKAKFGRCIHVAEEDETCHVQLIFDKSMKGIPAFLGMKSDSKTFLYLNKRL